VIEIRREAPEDAAAIRHLLEQAFPGPDEANLVEMLREADKARISLVATYEGQVVGHILFSPVTIDPAQTGSSNIGLAPVAILPEFQNRGIGSNLIREGLEECRKAGYDIVVVLGEAHFYARFGFSRAGDHGLGNEYGADEHFMALELREGALAEVSGMVRYQPEFNEVGG
jgi:putative acetyltransferase